MIVKTRLETTVVFDRKRVLRSFKCLIGDVAFDSEEIRKALWVEFGRYVDHLARHHSGDEQVITDLEEFFDNISWEVLPVSDYTRTATDSEIQIEFDLLIAATYTDLQTTYVDIANPEMRFEGVEAVWNGKTYHLKPCLVFKKQEHPPNTMYLQLPLF